MNKGRLLLLLVMGATPFVVSADAIATGLMPLVRKIEQFILEPLIALVFAAALIVFLWGVVQFVWGSAESSAREEGTRHIMYGLIGMFIMFSVYGIINLILNTLDVPQSERPETIKK